MNNKKSPAKEALSIKWATDPQVIDEMVSFFIDNVSAEYISHGEMQCGRAVAPDTWSPELREVLTEEFTSAVKRRIRIREGRRIILARDAKQKLAGLAVAAIQKSALNPYMVLEDLVIDKNRRCLGFGKQMLRWFEQQAASMGIRRIFLESGISNKEAHHFFTKNSFEITSVVMMKLLPEKSQ